MEELKLFRVIFNKNIRRREEIYDVDVLEEIVVATSKEEAILKVKDQSRFSQCYNFYVNELEFYGYKITVNKL